MEQERGCNSACSKLRYFGAASALLRILSGSMWIIGSGVMAERYRSRRSSILPKLKRPRTWDVWYWFSTTRQHASKVSYLLVPIVTMHVVSLPAFKWCCAQEFWRKNLGAKAKVREREVPLHRFATPLVEGNLSNLTSSSTNLKWNKVRASRWNTPCCCCCCCCCCLRCCCCCCCCGNFDRVAPTSNEA